MWRHLTRGFRQGFKRTIYFEKPDTGLKEGKSNSHHHSCYVAELLPSVFQNFNHCLSKQLCSDKNKREHTDEDSRNISHHSLLEACGWSGALVFGWVISKQILLKKTWTRDENAFLNKKIFIQQSFVELLADIVKNQPPAVSYVLPQLQSAPPVKSKNDIETESEFELEDEFEAAANQLLEVHEKAMGEALNRCGIACLSRSTGTEAMTYFQRASKYKYPPASFNMGQCYELGIGAEQDFKQAAEWYILASEQGHATAMYNLGVFYAHGWGGLRADIDTAKNMFIKAARLGQPDAKAALEKESKYDLLSKTNNVQSPFINNIETRSDQTELNFLVNKIKYTIGLADDVFPNVFKPEKNWDVSFNSKVAL